MLKIEILNLNTYQTMLVGAGLSLIIAVSAMLIGLVLGVIGAVFKLSKNVFLNAIAFVYVEFIRGTPMLLQISFLFMGFPAIFKAFTGNVVMPSPIVVGIIAMGINSGAYTTELIRAGIQGIDKGQWEASKSIGLTYTQTMRLIILPQVFKRILPPLVSEIIILIKDSSLVMVIGGAELMYRAKYIGARYYDSITPLILASILYLVMTMTLSFFARKLERRLEIND